MIEVIGINIHCKTIRRLLPFLYLAGRFGKIIPADPGTLLLNLFHRPRFPTVYDPARGFLLRQLWKKLYLWAVFWAITNGGLFALSYYLLPQSMIVYAGVLIWSLNVCTVIDAQYYLLPDFFTIPLLILGFMFHEAVNIQDMSFALTVIAPLRKTLPAVQI